ncbi:DUF4270 domain-containing protein [bacterium]|nr:DUF4270 domain-containing protein [bacterium]MDC1221799.1 DUF4270 domain-containing protein [Salibacteraceae bacterium]
MNYIITSKLIQRFVERQTVVVLILISIGTIGCKDDGLLGLEVQPDGQYDTLTLTDTFSVRAFTLEGERQRSDEAQSYIGRLQSPEFGSTESALIVNFSLITGNTVISLSGYSVDSVVLHLRPNQIYGVPQDEVPIDIFRVNEVLDVDGDYFSDFIPETQTMAIAEAILKYPRQLIPTDTINVDGEAEPFQFRIPLDIATGQELLNHLIDPVGPEDTEAFQNVFEGLMIKPTPGGLAAEATGAIYSMALLTGESGIRVYVSNDTERETLEFPINSKCARINQYQHDYQNSLAETYLNDSKDNDDLLFVQGLSGLRSEVHIPGLYNFGALNNTAIAKAILKFELSDKQNAFLGNSFQLFLLDLDADNLESLTLDYVYSPGRSGGRYDEESNGYEFDITRHVQRIVDAARSGEDVNYGLRLHAQVPVLNGNDTAHNIIQGLDNIAVKLYHTDLNN